MYQDLNPDNWPDDARIDKHPLIQRFFGGGITENEGESVSYAEEYSIDNIEDAHEKFPLKELSRGYYLVAAAKWAFGLILRQSFQKNPHLP